MEVVNLTPHPLVLRGKKFGLRGKKFREPAAVVIPPSGAV